MLQFWVFADLLEFPLMLNPVKQNLPTSIGSSIGIILENWIGLLVWLALWKNIMYWGCLMYDLFHITLCHNPDQQFTLSQPFKNTALEIQGCNLLLQTRARRRWAGSSLFTESPFEIPLGYTKCNAKRSWLRSLCSLRRWFYDFLAVCLSLFMARMGVCGLVPLLPPQLRLSRAKWSFNFLLDLSAPRAELHAPWPFALHVKFTTRPPSGRTSIKMYFLSEPHLREIARAKAIALTQLCEV